MSTKPSWLPTNAHCGGQSIGIPLLVWGQGRIIAWPHGLNTSGQSPRLHLDQLNPTGHSTRPQNGRMTPVWVPRDRIIALWPLSSLGLMSPEWILAIQTCNFYRLWQWFVAKPRIFAHSLFSRGGVKIKKSSIYLYCISCTSLYQPRYRIVTFEWPRKNV